MAPIPPGEAPDAPPRQRRRAVTIHDVARRAGVSSITVSRVLNGSAPTSEAARRRVEAAIRELGYVPNELAQSLKAHATRTIGLMVTDVSNRFFTAVARGVEDVAHAAGYCVILCNTDEDPAKQRLYLDMLGRKRVDGLVVAPVGDDLGEHNRALVAWARRHGPLCLVDRELPGVDCQQEGIDAVRTDNAATAARLVAHHIAHGHRRNAIVNGPAEVYTAAQRLAGYRQALQEAGIPADPSLEWHGQFTTDSGYAGAVAMLGLKQPPTAFFAANNFCTIGVLAALREYRVRVPGRCAVVGFDDIPELALVEPFLTVASQPASAIGRQAASCLLERIRSRRTPGAAGAEAVPGRRLVLPTEIIIRRSCGCPYAGLRGKD
jgi:LacI family transcriptional regulator